MRRPRPPSPDSDAPDELPLRAPSGPPPKRRALPPPAEPVDPDESPADSEDGSDDEEAAEGPEAAARAALRNVPFATLQRLKADGRGGTAGLRRGGGAESQGRANKNRPREQSSKRAVPFVVPQLVGAPGLVSGRVVGRDPRFDSLVTGPSDDSQKQRARKRYAFLFEETLPAERTALKAALAKATRPAKREQLKGALAATQAALKRDAAEQKAVARAAAARATERAAVAGGKMPFYPKKAAVKEAALVAQYEELKRSGGLEAFMAKRRAKLAAKDHVLMPRVRKGGEQ